MSGYAETGVERAILDVLQVLGGTASRNKIKQSIANNPDSGFDYDKVFETKISKAGNEYLPFDYTFNFGINNLDATEYIEKPKRGQDIVLTEKGRSKTHVNFPNKKEQEIIDSYWGKRAKNTKKKSKSKKVIPSSNAISDDIENDLDTESWKNELISQLKKFTPQKFESFSRLLISKMGVVVDDTRGKIMSRDHGIDGFGYFESDEFRTSRVAIQSKRYTDSPVSEPDVDKFKGVMDSFNAEYGIFITTTHFTEGAKLKAIQGSKSVTLIDGRRITDLVEKYQLHITPVSSFTLDDYYFEKK
ncbi:MAG TPA: restriction endonuclease [Candidatus Ligilactobacillus excrementipullorum]|nr:restriction endonuclease [Candidatus Ligilactobacillus excrementipullorum]